MEMSRDLEGLEAMPTDGFENPTVITKDGIRTRWQDMTEKTGQDAREGRRFPIPWAGCSSILRAVNFCRSEYTSRAEARNEKVTAARIWSGFSSASGELRR